MIIIKAAAGMRTLTQRPKAATAGYIEELRQTTGSMCRFPEEFGSISKERGRYRKAMEAGKEPRKGSFASVVMIAAIAVLISAYRA